MTSTQESPAGVAYHDLREFIARTEAFGELKRIRGANWQSEIGALTEINARRPDCKALLFDDIPGYPSGFRVLSSSANTARRLALALRIEAETTGELVTALRGGRITIWQNQSREFPPEYVAGGPVFECVQEGAQVDLEAFPAPVWHDRDGGRYIGTGNTVITADPESGWVNVGCYRNMIAGKNLLSLWMATRGRHGYQHIHRSWERGEPAPVVLTLGQDPLLSPVLAGMELHEGICELNVAGAIMGEPLQVVRGPVTGLPIPADAEIALEGWVRQGIEVSEGPHGEGTGYYAGGQHMVPAIEIAAVYHRRDPIMVGAPPGKPPHDFSYSSAVTRAALIHDGLDAAGLPGVVRVWCPPSGSARLLNIVVLKQRYFGHSKQAGLLASQVQAAAYLGRMTIVVDDDIDPENLGEVLWAVTTRAEPVRDYTILDHLWGSPIDPLNVLYPENTMYSSRVIIDACRPFEHRDDFPPVAASSPELLAEVWARWRHEFEPG